MVFTFLDERRARLEAARLEEGEDHAAADDDLVDLLHERLDHADLRRDLRAADDRREGALRLRDGAVKVVELLLEEEAGDRRREVLGHALGRAVRAVRRAEGVVDEEVGVRRELLGELGDVLLLLLVEARVLEKEDVALAHLANALRDALADAVR